jgi:hypothetical protein
MPPPVLVALALAAALAAPPDLSGEWDIERRDGKRYRETARIAAATEGWSITDPANLAQPKDHIRFVSPDRIEAVRWMRFGDVERRGRLIRWTDGEIWRKRR